MQVLVRWKYYLELHNSRKTTYMKDFGLKDHIYPAGAQGNGCSLNQQFLGVWFGDAPKTVGHLAAPSKVSRGFDMGPWDDRPKRARILENYHGT